MKKIIYNSETDVAWHKLWFRYYLSKYFKAADKLYSNLYTEQENIEFVLFLRSHGYDAWLRSPVQGEDYIYVNVSDEEYFMEELRASE